MVKGKIRTKDYTIDEVIKGKLSDKDQARGSGERIPDVNQSRKEFNVLFVTIDYDEMSNGEIDLISEQIEDLCYPGRIDDNIYNFWEATYGKGKLNAK